MPKKSSWLSRVFGSGKEVKERFEPGTRDDAMPGNIPEAPEEIRDLKWVDKPLRAKPKAEPLPPTPSPEIAQPVTDDPSMGLRRRSTHSFSDAPQSTLDVIASEAPEALEAVEPIREVDLPLEVGIEETAEIHVDVAPEVFSDPLKDQQLYEAARSGRVDEALRLLDEGANPRALPSESARDQRTLPLIAAVLPDLRLLRALIAKGINVNQATLGITPLIAACRDSWHGRPDAVMTLIANGSDVRCRDLDGNTPLHHAARSSDPGVAAMLIDASADLDALNNKGQSPIGVAMAAGNFRMAKFLLDKGAKAEPEGARPALIDAAGSDDDDVGGVTLLLRHKVKVDARDENQQTALHHAAANGNVEIVEMLLDAHANANLRDGNGMTPLLVAVANGRHRVFAVIKERAALDPDLDWMHDANGLSAIHHAMQNEDTTPELIQALLHEGADSGERDALGRTPIELAARDGRWSLVQVLDPEYVLPTSLRDLDDSETPSLAPISLLRDALDEGRESQHEDLVPLLNSYDLGLLLHQPSGVPTPARIQWLLRHAANPYVTDRRGDTPMFYCMDHMPSSLDAVNALLDAAVSPAGRGGLARLLGACVKSMHSPIWSDEIARASEKLALRVMDAGGDIFGTDEDGESPLIHAITLDWRGVVDRLLEAGVNANVRNRNGYTALHIATERGDETVVRQLIKHGSSPSALAADGQAPLGLALTNGHTDLVRWLDWRKWNFPNRALRDSDLPGAAMIGDLEAVRRLLDLGFNVDAVDDRSCSALLRAAGGGHRPVVKLLLERGANAQLSATSGATPLSAAASMRQLPIIDDLLEAGADTERKLPGDLSVLTLSAALGLPDVCERLLKSGANVAAVDAQGRTPLHCAAMQSFSAKDPDKVVALLDVLLSHGAGSQIKVEAGGSTPLHLLLGSRAEPGTQAHEPAVIAGIEKLLGAGADIEARDPRGFTALHLAALHGLSQVVKRLLIAGSDTEARDSLNRRPQELALMRGYIDISSELEAHGHHGDEHVSVANLLNPREG